MDTKFSSNNVYCKICEIKTNDIHSAVLSAKYHVVMITESRLKNADDNFIIKQPVSSLNLFVLIPLNFCKGGGVLLNFKQNLKPKNLQPSCNTDFETVVCSLYLLKLLFVENN